MNVYLEARISCIRNTAAIVEAAKNLLRESLISLLCDSGIEADIEPLVFNDETGFPCVISDTDGLRNVYGLRVRMVNGTPAVEFNSTCGDDDYGLDPDAWYNPDVVGRYDVSNILDCVAEVLKSRKA